jgi:hypothetical protein
VSPAIGFRVWRIDEQLTGPRLTSPNRYTTWLPDAPVRARCIDESGAPILTKAHRKEPQVAPPIEGCTCGIYAYHEPVQMVSSITSHLVGGAILAWGRLTIHPEGFRAEFARPLALCYPHMFLAGSTAVQLARLADRYRLPVLDVSHVDVFAAEFGERYSPEAEPSAGWTVRVATSLRRVLGGWFRA